MDGRAQTLTWQLQLTGYGRELLTAIAEATLPAHEQNAPVREHELAVLLDAIDVLAQAGWRAVALHAALRYCRERFGERWRELFWRASLRMACMRFEDAPRYGVSPLETDPVRLARWGPAPDWTPTPSVAASVHEQLALQGSAGAGSHVTSTDNRNREEKDLVSNNAHDNGAAGPKRA